MHLFYNQNANICTCMKNQYVVVSSLSRLAKSSVGADSHHEVELTQILINSLMFGARYSTHTVQLNNVNLLPLLLETCLIW